MDKQAYEMMGFPLNKDFKNMVHIMLIYNLPITPDVVTASKTIYGTNLHLLKWKTVRKNMTLVTTYYIDLTTEIMKEHRDVTVEVNIM